MRHPSLNPRRTSRWSAEQGFRPAILRRAVLAALAMPGVAFGNNIQTDGHTDTFVDEDGNVTEVTTETKTGRSGFNSFARFEVESGKTVNLHVPEDADNLVNLVHDAKTIINGELQGLQDGEIGGNIVFANPHGFVVGSSGVVNVGSLVVTTPSGGEMQGLLDAIDGDGDLMDEEVAALMRGDYRSSGDGEIRIEGEINAEGGINLFAANAVVSDEGSVEVDVDVDDEAWEVFRNAVNVGDMDDPRGSITVGASESVEVDGRLAALMEQDNGASASATRGDIHVTGQDVRVGESGEVVTVGDDSAVAGDITLQARAVERCLLCDEDTASEAADDYGLQELAVPKAMEDRANEASLHVDGRVDARMDGDASGSGDVTLRAHAEDVQIVGLTSSDAEVVIGGHVSGADVTASAEALSMVTGEPLGYLPEELVKNKDDLFEFYTSLVKGAWHDDFSGLEDLLDVGSDFENWSQLQAVQQKVAVSRAGADATISIEGSVDAEGDLDARTGAVRHVENYADGAFDFDFIQDRMPFNAGLAWSDLTGDSRVEVADGAKLNVEGDLDLEAVSHNTLDQSAAGQNSRDADGKPYLTMGFALGAAYTDTQTEARVADGARVEMNEGSDVRVSARSEQDLSNEVEFNATGDGALGGPAFALGYFNSETRASFAADLDDGNDLSVHALNIVHEQRNTSATKVGTTVWDDIESKWIDPLRPPTDYVDFLNRGIEKALKIGEKEGGDQNENKKPAENNTLRFASALTLGLSDHLTDASLGMEGDGADVSVDGNVDVAALQHQARLRNHAVSEANSNAKSEDGVNYTLSVALVASNTDMDTRARIGDGSDITAGNIVVGARNEIPLQVDLDESVRDMDKWDSFSDVLERAENVYEDIPDAVQEVPSQYARAFGDAEKVSMAGAISVMRTDINTEAWVGDDVTLEATDEDPEPFSSILHQEFDDSGNLKASWTLNGRTRTDPADFDEDDHDWQGGIQLRAESDIERLGVAGNFGMLLFGSTGDKGAVGGNLNLAHHDATTLAGIGANGDVSSASRVDVGAKERNLRMMVSPSASRGETVAGAGSAVANWVDSDVVALVDSSTDLETPDATITAEQDLGQWSAVGALGVSENVGVGLGLAINYVDTEVEAGGGDTRPWRPFSAPGRDPDQAGTWALDMLRVRSESRGQNGAFGVAGALARDSGDKNTDQQAGGTQSTQDSGQGLFSSLKGQLGKATSTFTSWKDKLAGYKQSGGDDANAETDIESEDQSLPADVSAAGSATLNVSDQSTRALLHDVTLEGREEAPDVSVRGLSQMQQYSGSGTGALTMGGKDSDGFSTALSGALAGNWLMGGTQADVQGVTGRGLDRMDVEAVTGGDHVVIGAGLAVATGSGSPAVSVAMSGSLAGNQTSTSASVEDSELDFDQDGDDDLQRSLTVRGYDRTRSLLGGGALAGSGGKKGASAGGSVVVGVIANELEARMVDTRVTGARDVTVEAASQTRVLSGAIGASVAASKKGAALAGSGFVTYMANQVNAEVVDGEIEGDNLEVVAHSVGGLSTLDGLFDPDASASLDGAELDLEGNVLEELDSEVEVTDENEAGDEEDPEVETHSLFDSELAGEFVIGVSGALSAGGTASGGGSAGVVYSGSDYSASVTGTRLELDGDASVKADYGVETLGVAVGAAAAGKAGVMGSATAIVDRGNVRAGLYGTSDQRLDVEADELDVTALHSGGYYSFAGALAASGGGAGSAAIGITDIENAARADLVHADLNIEDDFNLRTGGANVIRSAAVSGSAGSGGVAGSLSYNRIAGEALAYVEDAEIDAENVGISSAQDATGGSIWSAAGGISAGGGVGGAIAINLNESVRRTSVDASSVNAAGDINLDSGARSEIYSLAVGAAAASEGFTLGGSLAYNRIYDRAEVLVDATTLEAESIESGVDDGAARIATLAGGVAVGGTAVGGSVATSSIGQVREIWLSDSHFDARQTMELHSGASGEIYSLSIAGAASGGEASLAGAVTEASIDSENRVVLEDTSGEAPVVTLDADDRSTIHSFGLAAGLGAQTGGGAGAAVNRLDNVTEVRVRGHRSHNGTPQSLDAGHLTLSAAADQTIRSAAAGAGVGQSAGMAGSLAVNLGNSDVTAMVEDGAQLNVLGNMAVHAANDSRIQSIGGALGIGAGQFGAAGSIGVNILESSTRAGVRGEETVVEVLGQESDDWLEAPTADIANAPDPTDWEEPEDFNPVLDLERDSKEVRGLSVNAVSSQQMGSLSGAISATTPTLSGSVALTGVGTTSVMGGTTEASIDAATVNPDDAGHGDVHVAAGSNVYGVGYNLAAAAGGDIAASGAADVALVDHATRARVRDADIHTDGDLNIEAQSARAAANFITSGAAGLVGGSGSLGVMRLAGVTEASHSGGVSTVGNLNIQADDRMRMAPLSGNVNAGLAGAGAAFTVALNEGEVRARLGAENPDDDDTEVRTDGDVDVRATSDTELLVNSLAATAGAATVAGAANGVLLENEVEALINGAKVRGESGEDSSRAGSVRVEADNLSSLMSNAGSASVGLVSSAGASLNVVITNNATRALVQGADLRTRDDLEVNADHRLSTEVNTVTAGTGAGASLGGSFGLLMVGPGAPTHDYDDDSDADASFDLDAMDEADKDGDGTLSALDGLADADGAAFTGRDSGAEDGDYDGSTLTSAEEDRVNGANDYSFADAMNEESRQETRASVDGSTIDTGESSVSIEAVERLDVEHQAGSAQGGGAAVGAAGAMTFLRSSVSAGLSSSSVHAGDVGVSARVRNASDEPGARVHSLAGTAGFSGGLGASVAVLDARNSVSAAVGGDLDSGSGLDVSATDELDQESRADGAAVGGTSAVGVSIAALDRSTVVQSHLLEGADVTADEVSVEALGKGSSDAQAVGASGGLVGSAVNGAIGLGLDQATVAAVVGDNVNLDADTVVTVEHTGTVDVAAEGMAVSGNTALGAAVAIASSERLIDAVVRDDVQVEDGRDLTIEAAQGNGSSDDVHAEAWGASGGGLAGANASIALTYGADVLRARVGDRLTMNDGTLRVETLGEVTREARAWGLAVGGALAAGASVALTEVDTETEASLGDGLSLGESQRLDVVVVNTDVDQENRAYSEAGSGGVVAGNASVAEVHAEDQSRTSVGDDGVILADRIRFTGESEMAYGVHSNSVNAAVAGMSGARARSNVAIDNQLDVGGSDLVALERARYEARSEVSSTHPEDDTAVEAAGGGVVSGQAVDNETNVTLDTDVNVMDGASLFVGSMADEERRPLVLAATNTVGISENASLATGGAVSGNGVGSEIGANYNAGVTVGDADLLSYGDLLISTLTQSYINHDASANTWGGAAATDARATTEVRNNHDVEIGSGASLTSYGWTSITPGMSDNRGRQNDLMTQTTANSLVRGIVAIANAVATADQETQATVSLADGAAIESGRDVEFLAFHDRVDAFVEGLAKGYQAGMVPVEREDSRRSSGTETTLNVDGDITAGIFDRLDIVIDEDGNLDVNEDAPDFYAEYQPEFNPGDLVDALLDEDVMEEPVAEVLRRGIVDDTVEAYFLDGLYASGGSIRIHADDVRGAGEIEARGSPYVGVTNESDHYLRLGSVYIPADPGGEVVFRGRADALPDSMTKRTEEGSGEGQIEIENTRSEPLDGEEYGPALFQEGAISNDTGRVDVSVANGAFAALASMRGRYVAVDIEGPMVVNPVEENYWSPGTQPEMVWAPTRGLPEEWEDEPGELVKWAVAAAALEEYGEDDLASSNEGILEQFRPRWPNDDDLAGESVIVFGGCRPGVYSDQGTLACTASTASNEAPESNFWPGLYTQILDIDGTGDDSRQSHVPVVPTTWSADVVYEDQTEMEDEGSATWSGSEAVAISADILDVNGTIQSGRATERGVEIGEGLDDYLEHLEEMGLDEGRVDIPRVGAVLREDEDGETVVGWQEIWQGPSGGGRSEPVEVVYDFDNEEIVAEDVAASGGGYLYLQGEVINSTGNGRVEVESRYGQIDISSETDHDIRTGRLDTGSGAVGLVIIADELRDQTTWYRYAENDGLERFATDGTEDVSLADADHVARYTGVEASYSPKDGARFNWTEIAEFSRDYDHDANSIPAWMEDWVFDDIRDPWETVGEGEVVVDPDDDSAFRQEASGGFTSTTRRHVRYSYGCPEKMYVDCDNGMFVSLRESAEDDDDDDSFYARWRYEYPVEGYLELERSARADYTIDIEFGGFDEGRIEVDAGGDVTLDGDVYNPSGHAEIRAREGQIRSVARGILTNSADLEARADVGSTNAALEIEMAEGMGDLRGVSHEGEVALNVVDSGVQIDEISASGDVVLDSFGDVLAGDPEKAPVHVKGRNVTLMSEVGGVGTSENPLQLKLNPTDRWDYKDSLNLQNLSLDDIGHDGVLSVDASRGVGVDVRDGDLWVGGVHSEYGDVYVAADGYIRDAAERTGEEMVDAEQREAIWKRLRLRDRDGADERAEEYAVKPFEAEVERAYEEYWGLREAGELEDGELKLDADGLEHYRTILRSRGLEDDDDAVRSYAEDRWGEVTGIFAERIGEDWSSGEEFSEFDPDFGFTASAEQYEALTSDSAWSDRELIGVVNEAAFGELDDGGGVVVDAEPNISGNDVKIEARGRVGESADPLRVDRSDLEQGELSDEALVALARAYAPGDVEILRDENDEIEALDVQRSIPLYVDALGQYDMEGVGDSYVQGLSSLRIGDVTVDDGDARLMTNDHILAADEAPGRVGVQGDLTLGAATGGIGEPGNPLQLSLGGSLEAGMAQEGVYLDSMEGDLEMGRLVAGGPVRVRVPDGGIYRTSEQTHDGVTISGDGVALEVSDGDDGSIGTEQDRIGIRLTGVDAELEADAGGDIQVWMPEDTRMGRMHAGGAIGVIADEGLEFDGSVTGGEDVAINARSVEFRDDTDLASGGDATLSADQVLSIGDGVRWNVTDDLRTASGEWSAGEDSRLDVGSHARLDSGGAWSLGNGSVLESVGDVELTATDMMMGEDARIVGRADAVQGDPDDEAVQGVFLEASGDALLEHLESTEGEIDVTVDGDLQLVSASGRNGVVLTGGDILVVEDGSLNSGADAMIDAAGALQFDEAVQATAVDGLHLSSGRSTRVGQGALFEVEEGDLRMDAGADTSIGETVVMDVAGDALLDTAGDWVFGAGAALEAGGDVTLDAQDVAMERASDIDADGRSDLYAAGGLTMAPDSRLAGAAGIDVISVGHVRMTRMETVDGRIAVDADGDIVSNGDPERHFLATGDGRLDLLAGGTVGLEEAPLWAEMPAFDRLEAGDGGVFVEWVGGAEGGDLVASGEIDLHMADGDLVFDRARADTSVEIVNANGDITFGDPDDGLEEDHVRGGLRGEDRVDIRAESGDVTGGNLRGGSVSLAAGGDVHFGAVRAEAPIEEHGGDAVIDADRDIVGNTVRASRDLEMDAGRALVLNLDELESPPEVALEAGRHLRIAAGHSIDLGGWIKSGGEMEVRSREADVRVVGARSGRDEAFSASMDVVAATDLSVDESMFSDNAGMRTTAGGDARVGEEVYARDDVDWVVGGDMRVGQSVTAENGDMDLAVGGVLDSRVLEAGEYMDVVTGGSSLTLERALAGDDVEFRVGEADNGEWADDGALTVGEMTGADINLRTADRVSIDEVSSSGLLDIATRWVDIGTARDAGDNPLELYFRGLNETASRGMEAHLETEQVVSHVHYVEETHLTQSGEYATFEDARFVDYLDLVTGAAHVRMDNTDSSYAGVDTQLREIDQAFWMDQQGEWTFTDAHVLHYEPGFRVAVPNFTAERDEVRGIDYIHSSAARYIERMFDASIPGVGSWPMPAMDSSGAEDAKDAGEGVEIPEEVINLDADLMARAARTEGMYP